MLLGLVPLAALLCAWPATSSSLLSPSPTHRRHHHVARRSAPPVDPLAVHRVMADIAPFSEACAANCTAANVAAATAGVVCPLEPSRRVSLGSTLDAAAVVASEILTQREKDFFVTAAAKDFVPADSVLAQRDDQFSRAEHLQFYYDPTRFPPVYSQWSCDLASTGLHAPCRLPAVEGSSAPLQYGICRHVCDRRLSLRRVRKAPTCSVPNASPAAVAADGSQYVWTYCLMPLKTGLICTPQETGEIDFSCVSVLPDEDYCSTFDEYAAAP